MIVATGNRVPLNTQAPPTLPGMLSTAGHRDQSSVATRTPSLQITAKSRGRHAGSSDGLETLNLPQPALQLVPTRGAAVDRAPEDGGRRMRIRPSGPSLHASQVSSVGWI